MDAKILHWAASSNFEMMSFAALYLREILYTLSVTLLLIGITPMSFQKDETNTQALLVIVRKTFFYMGCITALWLAIMALIFEFTNVNNDPHNLKKYLTFLNQIVDWVKLGTMLIITLIIKFIHLRYLMPFISSLKRKYRNVRSDEKESDIRDEKNSTKLKSFNPQKYYKKDNIFIALDENNMPLYVPIETWRKTNMQIIGPTRYGKGVAIGVIADQVVKIGDSVIYIDPKNDQFIPQIMYQTACEEGRPFIYLTLHDNGLGYYSPFKGGSERDGISRMVSAFKLETTGHPGTDYYKRLETEVLTAAFKTGRSINNLLNTLHGNEKASGTNAEMAAWSEIKSLCPPKNVSSFSIKKALLDGCIVYVQGKLDDAVVKTATKVFIREIIQESKSLVKERQHHLTVIVDEVSFLVSKTLAEATSTILADNVNFVLAYQSIDDLLNLDDATVNPRYINQNINVNCQLKLVYGGKDFPTAEWVSLMSGTMTKAVTRLEKTDVGDFGGEKWEDHRQISNVTENLISTNQILSLPPQVACLIQPNQLATLAYTSFVAVKDTNALSAYLDQYIPTADRPESLEPSLINKSKTTPKVKPKKKKQSANKLSTTAKPKPSHNDQGQTDVNDAPIMTKVIDVFAED